MQVSQIDRGAFIGEFSQYEAEEEHVLPPLSHFEILSKTRKFNVNVYRLKINCNLRAQTLEEIRGNRRSMVLDLAQKLNQEFQELMDREAREIAKILAGSVDPVGPEYFNQGDHFSEIISKLEKAFVKELEEEEAALHEAAKAIPEGEREEDRLAKLRLRLKIRRRCSQDNAAGKQAVLSAHEDLVAALVSCGASDSEAADDMIELALVREETASNFAGALKLLEDALQLKRALTPPSPPADQALILHRQGRVYSALGRYQESLEYYGQALDIRVQVFGREHPLVAGTHNNMGEVYRNQGKYEEALQMYEKAQEVYLAVYGRDHLATATTYMNQGVVYERMGQYDKALEAHSKSLDIKIRVVGQDHPSVANTLLNIGGVYYQQGKEAEAKELLSRAYHIRLDKLGPNHPETTKLEPFL